MLPLASALLFSLIVSCALLFLWSDRRRRMATGLCLFAIAACDTQGCAAVQKAGPTLDAVVSRVDVPRLLQCAGAGDAKAVAKCLGASVLTQGLEMALDHATTLAEDAELAANRAAGADDMSDADRDRLAADLDAALDDLAEEIATANAIAQSAGSADL